MRLLSCAILVLCLARCSGTRIVSDGPPVAFITTDPAGKASPTPLPILIVADNQEHNLFGGYIQSMSALTHSWVTKVAVRPPEVDLWSKYVLRAFLSDATDAGGAKVVLHLGDASDIACTTEFESFVSSMNRGTAGMVPWLMVPGNHDSFLAGNFNNYIAKSPSKGFVDAFVRPARSWSGACASLDATGEATTKEILIARIRMALESQGVEFRVADKDIPIMEVGVECEIAVGSPRPDSKLAALRYQAVVRVCKRTDLGGGKYVGPWESFIVQRLDVGGGAIGLLLDTTDVGSSTLYSAVEGVLPKGQGDAAQKGELRDGQRRAIEFLLGQENAGRVVGFGHSPWVELTEGSRDFLTGKGVVAFVSAHTHLRSSTLFHRSSPAKAGVCELNVGSTTDWPIQALQLGITSTQDSVHVSWRSLGAQDGDAQPGWIRSCVDKAASWRASDEQYRSYIEEERYRKFVDLVPGHEPYQPLENAIAAAERVVFGDRMGRCRVEDGLETLKYPGPDGEPTERWTEVAQLYLRAKRLEKKMDQDPVARTYGICQAVWAARAVRDEDAAIERVTKSKPPSGFANESTGVTLTTHR